MGLYIIVFILVIVLFLVIHSHRDSSKNHGKTHNKLYDIHKEVRESGIKIEQTRKAVLSFAGKMDEIISKQ